MASMPFVFFATGYSKMMPARQSAKDAALERRAFKLNRFTAPCSCCRIAFCAKPGPTFSHEIL